MPFTYEYFYKFSCYFENTHHIDQKDQSGRILFDRETILRISISRIYYSSYHYCYGKASHYNIFTPKRNSHDHRNLIHNLKADMRYKCVGEKLEYLRDRRNVCDYYADGIFFGKKLDFEAEFKSCNLYYNQIKSKLV